MQYNQKSNLLLTSAVLLTSLCAATSAHASGFGIFTQGASALGQANAVVAHTDEPSAIYFNPALINKLPGTQIEVGTTLLFPSRDFKSSATGVTASTEDTVYYPSTFYVSHAFNDKISAGLGIFNPFGLGTEWNGDWEGKYLATKSKIETFNFNPVVSYRIIPGLSFAAGLDVIYLDASLEQKMFPSNANQKFKGDGTGVGYNLGLAYDAGHGISAGVSYRSEVDMDIDGELIISIPGVPSMNAKTKLTLPRQLTAGLAYQATDRFTVESGFRWEDWRSYKQLKLEVEGLPDTIIPKNWHDTFAVNVGGKYRLNDTFTLLGGYLYGWNAIPDDTFEPGVPDSNTHLFTIGTDMKFNRFKLAVSYAYQLQEERTKNNAVGFGLANGEYNADIHLLGLSLAYKF
ncbi:MAG: aromatic hydrocarbon degradation protein [Geobacter sp.]|nr:aromatic hydrocarbon degradation protein [Geobacter sp.]